jgi:hypothetical protein
VKAFFFFLVVLEFELRASRFILGMQAHWSHCLVLGISEIGSPELFAWGWLQSEILLISAY